MYHSAIFLICLQVYVEWQDGQIYEAYYRGKAPVKKFNVEIEPAYSAKFNGGSEKVERLNK
jgi:hypothetical protein